MLETDRELIARRVENNTIVMDECYNLAKRGVKWILSKKKSKHTLDDFLEGVKPQQLTPEDQVERRLRNKLEVLKKKFSHLSNWSYLTTGGTKDVYVSQAPSSGLQAPIQIAVKADMTLEEFKAQHPSSRAEHAYSQNHRALREAETSPKSSSIPGFLPVLFTESLHEEGYPGCYAFGQPYFKSITLDQLLEIKSRVPTDIAVSFAKQMFTNAAAFANERGLLHRDYKPSNVLIGLEEEKGKVVFTDSSQATSVADENERTFVTAAGTPTVAPWLVPANTAEKPFKYDQSADVHSLVKMFGMLLLGKDFLPVNPYTLTPIKKSEYHSKLKEALRRLPTEANKYKGLLFDGLRMDEKRIQNLDQLVNVFEKINDSRSKIWRGAAVAAALTIGTLGTFGYHTHREAERQRIKLEHGQSTIELNAGWDGQKVALSPSGVFELYTWVSMQGNRYPEGTSVVRVMPGEDIIVGANIVEKPLPKTDWKMPYSHFPIVVSIDGVTQIAPQKFHRPNKSPNAGRSWHPMGGDGYPSSTLIQVPANMPEGQYTLKVNVGFPINNNDRTFPGEYNLQGDNSKFLVEQRIPFVVGKSTKDLIKLRELVFATMESRFEYAVAKEKGSSLEYDPYSKEINNYNVRFSIPELGFSETRHIPYGSIPTPAPRDAPFGSYTLLIDVLHKGNVVLQEAFPVNYSTNNNAYNIQSWSLTRPSLDFNDKVRKFRSEMEKNSNLDFKK